MHTCEENKKLFEKYCKTYCNKSICCYQMTNKKIPGTKIEKWILYKKTGAHEVVVIEFNMYIKGFTIYKET